MAKIASALPGAFGLAAKYTYSLYPKTAAYLESIGVDPATVSIYGIGADGYDEFLFESGRRVPRDGDYAVERRDWPSQNVAREVLFGMLYEDMNREEGTEE